MRSPCRDIDFNIDAIKKLLLGRGDHVGQVGTGALYATDPADLPPFDNYAMQDRTYRYYAGTPVYPFGAGLSYTSFRYAPLRIAPVKGAAENGVVVTIEITNTGARAGDEVAQLYLAPPTFEGAPRLALRGFQRVSLQPGERRQLTFRLTPRDLSFVTRDGTRQLMPGQFQLSVGSGQPGTGAASQSAPLVLNRTVVLPQ